MGPADRYEGESREGMSLSEDQRALLLDAQARRRPAAVSLRERRQQPAEFAHEVGLLAGSVYPLGGVVRDPVELAPVDVLDEPITSSRHRAGGLAGGGPVPLFWPGVIPRNLFFLAAVLAHRFRRGLPPY